LPWTACAVRTASPSCAAVTETVVALIEKRWIPQMPSYKSASRPPVEPRGSRVGGQT
jgi:hypothetical protein